ncbi:hypothetical protein A1O7_09259 [Cladophialophora yegresii CBS 114405]|uniref:Uncharacterized protein n=1 Tax=Cladophialophora yegresii CBS 114405 TaxID=1182544 RepID=W9VEN5_9EURO|nr:uncharacterized protein A1O7_09259 [Cladophialophora yegresii CBS 114405]EXJ53923.1 hypothetical protein A1O7_09259 [Cladophialophora yegresii CBS 114405]
MSMQSARYDALQSTPPGHRTSRPPVSKYNAVANGSSGTNLFVAGLPEHHDGNATMPDLGPDTHDRSPQTRGSASSSRRSMMRDYKKEIILTCLLLLLPLPLSAVLMYLIYANLQPRSQDLGFPDSITADNTDRPLSKQDYYVNYSATRLVFISSLSSTLALALVPVAMTLFAYMAAFTLQKASRARKMAHLPSPFQFELTIRLLGGSTTDLYRYLKYMFRRRPKRVAAVPMLNSSALALLLMLILAVCITVVDALLHIGTSTVQYHNTVEYLETAFNPGRRLSTDCWNATAVSAFAPCNVNPGGSGASASFANSTEAYLTLGNQSTRNTIRLGDDGETAILTPASAPSGVHFRAQSYASATTCEPATKRCKPHYNGDGYCNACQSWAYNCTPDAAGLRVSGNFSDIRGQSGLFPVLLEFFNTSSKEFNTSVGPVHGHVWSAVLFSLPAGTDEAMRQDGEDSPTIDGMYYDPTKDLVADTYGNIYGILSCTTLLSEVTYSVRMDGSIHDAVTTPMNDTASSPFYFPLTYGFGRDNLGTGINLAAASAGSPHDLAYQVSRVLDRTILGLTAGSLPDRQAVGAFLTQTRQVAKVPIAEFVALIVLNLVLPVVGIVLGVWAWVLCERHGVRDVQARLGIGALVAALFEDQRFNATATKMEQLYAEARSLPTARVVVDTRTREKGGGKVLVAVAEDGGCDGDGSETYR